MNSLTPPQLLTRAQQMSLLGPASAHAESYWPRAAALLARMALESAVTAALMTIDQQLMAASMRSKLLLLPLVMSEPAVSAANDAWAGLSRACHQHPYELAPTRSELVSLIDRVKVVVIGAT